MYGQIIQKRLEALSAKVQSDPQLAKQYKQLQFAEKDMNGEAAVVGRSATKKGQAVAALSLKRSRQASQLASRADRVHFINKKRK
jgi:hypothetical protein